MGKITKIISREILDSRGNPTIEADLFLDSGVWGRASAPSGASTGSREALELRDQDKARYLGKGVLLAVDAVNSKIEPALLGKDPVNQREIDNIMIELDGTENKEVPLYQHISELNNSPGVYSMPVPMMNIINGGEHADNNVDIQEFMVQPVGATSFKEGLRMGVEIFHHLKKVLSAKGLNTTVGDEGGFAPNLVSNEEALEVIVEAVSGAGYKMGEDVTLALDCAASEFYADNTYNLKGEGRSFDSNGFGQYLAGLSEKYPILSIEDGLDESDWDGWKYLTDLVGKVSYGERKEIFGQK